MTMTGDVIAEHDDDIGVERIGAFDDLLDAVERHPGIAGVNVGDHGDFKREIGGPLPRRQAVLREPQLQHRLAKPVGRGGGADGAYSAERTKELTS
jgi:hypothetical protein